MNYHAQHLGIIMDLRARIFVGVIVAQEKCIVPVYAVKSLPLQDTNSNSDSLPSLCKLHLPPHHQRVLRFAAANSLMMPSRARKLQVSSDLAFHSHAALNPRQLTRIFRVGCGLHHRTNLISLAVARGGQGAWSASVGVGVAYRTAVVNSS